MRKPHILSLTERFQTRSVSDGHALSYKGVTAEALPEKADGGVHPSRPQLPKRCDPERSEAKAERSRTTPRNRNRPPHFRDTDPRFGAHCLPSQSDCDRCPLRPHPLKAKLNTGHESLITPMRLILLLLITAATAFAQTLRQQADRAGTSSVPPCDPINSLRSGTLPP